MEIDDKKIYEKILSFYKNNVELNPKMSEFDKGYLQCLIDISHKKI